MGPVPESILGTSSTRGARPVRVAPKCRQCSGGGKALVQMLRARCPVRAWGDAPGAREGGRGPSGSGGQKRQGHRGSAWFKGRSSTRPGSRTREAEATTPPVPTEEFRGRTGIHAERWRRRCSPLPLRQGGEASDAGHPRSRLRRPRRTCHDSAKLERASAPRRARGDPIGGGSFVSSAAAHDGRKAPATRWSSCASEGLEDRHPGGHRDGWRFVLQHES